MRMQKTALFIWSHSCCSTDREDMGGVGNFNRNCKTLYISGIKHAPGDNLEDILARHFGEWGEITHSMFADMNNSNIIIMEGNL